jgi:hypothetical protein
MTNLNDQTPSAPKTLAKHTGGCHCGAVRFEVELEAGVHGGRCNCSVCTKIAPTSAIVKPSALRLLKGKESLSTYVWGAAISTRYFCKHCGVHCYGVGHLAEVGGDYASPNLNCLDELDVSQIPVLYWDGRHNNWEGGPRSTPWPRFTADEGKALPAAAE